MTEHVPIARRTVLVACAGAAGGAALAACGGGSSGGSAPASRPAGKSLGSLASVPIGRAKAVTLPDGGPAVLARPSGDSVVCFSAVCTHQGCTVHVDGGELNCPCHGSRFDALTGAVLQGPAVTPLRRVRVKVSGGAVVTA